MKQVLFFALIFTFNFSVFNAQVDLNQDPFASEPVYKLFIGVSNDFFSVRSANNFGFWSSRRNTGIPFQRGERNKSTFSILPYAGISLSESVDLGLAFNHRSESSRTTITEGEIDPVDISFLSRSNLNGFGLFSRMTVYSQKRWGLYLRPAVMYYQDDYKEFLDSRKDLHIIDEFIYLNVGVGAYYEFTDQLRGLARFSGISYVNGRWREVGTDIGESYSETGRNYSRSGIYLGVEWWF
jgi:hypothetical protein